MVQITIKMERMARSMRESRVNGAVRRAFSGKKVTSAHKKGETVPLSKGNISGEGCRSAIEPTGYRVLGAVSEPYEKKGLFGLGGQA